MELLGRIFQRSRITARFVFGYSGPIQGFRRGICIRQSLDNFTISLLGFRPLLSGKRCMGQSQLELCQEIIGW